MSIIRRGFSVCWIAGFAIFSVLLSLTNCSADDEAGQGLAGWTEALHSADRISASFRQERINHVFQRKEVQYGRYFRDGDRRWCIIISDGESDAVSALNPSNSTDSKSRRYLILRNDDDYVFGDPDSDDLEHLSHATMDGESKKPLSWNPLARFGHHISQSFVRAYTTPMAFPVMLAEDIHINTYDLRHHRINAQTVILTLTPQPDCPLRNEFRRVDAVLVDGNPVPTAIRTLDPAGTVEVRWYVTSFNVNAEADIPSDAFDLPVQISLKRH